MNKRLLTILTSLLLTVIIYLSGYHKTAILLFIIICRKSYTTSDFYLDMVRTKIEETTFTVKGLVVPRDITTTKARQKVVNDFIKHAEAMNLFTAYNGRDNKEAKEMGGVYYVDNDFDNIFKCIDEPTNEYDPNAIRVELLDYGHIGYIEKEKTDLYREMINSGIEYKITNHISGGKLKGRGHVKNEYYNASITFTRTIYYTLRDKVK